LKFCDRGGTVVATPSCPPSALEKRTGRSDAFVAGGRLGILELQYRCNGFRQAKYLRAKAAHSR
jgi:hypothetical protein